MAKPWILKYMPKTASEILGQDVARLRGFIEGFRREKRKGLVVWGPPGTGKTSAVHAVASDLSLEIIEINASDFRSKAMIESVVGAAAAQRSLFAKGKVILVDEIDGLSAADRGGLVALTALLAGAAHPVVMTSFDPHDRKYSQLRRKAALLEFGLLDTKVIYSRLQEICAAERVTYAETALRSLARRAGGDMRAAINDLQTLSAGVSAESLAFLPDRMQREGIGQALLKIFKTTDPAIALGALDNVDIDPDQAILWLEENIPREYKNPGDLARAFDALSRADVYRRRIRRRQHWRFLIYLNSLLSAGVALAKATKYRNVTEYREGRRVLKIWIANQRYAKRKGIAAKLAQKTHTSQRRAMEMVPYVRKFSGPGICEWLELDDDEQAWLCGEAHRKH